MKELNRLTVLNAIEAGTLMALEAAQLLGMSLRQVRRLLANYRLKGAAGLAHGNRGRPSPQRLPHSVQEQILQLVRTCYLDYNDQHCCEELAEKHGIHVSRSTPALMICQPGQSGSQIKTILGVKKGSA